MYSSTSRVKALKILLGGKRQQTYLHFPALANCFFSRWAITMVRKNNSELLLSLLSVITLTEKCDWIRYCEKLGLNNMVSLGRSDYREANNAPGPCLSSLHSHSHPPATACTQSHKQTVWVLLTCQVVHKSIKVMLNERASQACSSLIPKERRRLFSAEHRCWTATKGWAALKLTGLSEFQVSFWHFLLSCSKMRGLVRNTIHLRKSTCVLFWRTKITSHKEKHTSIPSPFQMPLFW